MVLYRDQTGRDTIVIWIYTSILGNKQSTINDYINVLFFPFHIQKGWGDTNSVVLPSSISAWFKFFPTPHWHLSSLVGPTEYTPRRKARKKKKKCEPLAFLDFHSSYRTNSLWLLFNADRSLRVVIFHISTWAGTIGLQSAGGIRSNGATQLPGWHHALRQDLQSNNEHTPLKTLHH